MAFVSDPTQDDDEAAKQKQEQQDRLVNSNPVTGGGTSIFGQAPAAGAATNGNVPPKSNSSGTGWVGIDSYLNANKDQAAGMGQKLAGTVNSQAQGASDAVGKLSSDFSNTVQQNTVNFDPTSVNRDISDASSLKAGATYDPNDVSDFQKYAGAAFKGPADLSQDANYTGVAKQVSDAQNGLGELGSEPGREQLLNETYGGATPYTRGESQLDNALIQTSTDAQKSLSDTARQWSGIGSLLGSANAKASTEAATAKATDAATALQAQKALGSYATDASGTGGAGALGSWSSGLYGQTDAAGKNYKDAQDALTASEGNGQWTPAQLAALGLDSTMHTYGVNLGSNYITPGANSPGMANVANADQYAQQVALAKLAGVLPGGAAAIGNPLLNQANAAQAGTAAGVNGNAMATLSPTFMSDVNAAGAGIGNRALQTVLQYEQQNPNSYWNAGSLNSYDPTTHTINLQLTGPGSTGGGNNVILSADPTSPYYIGNASQNQLEQNGLVTPQTSGAQSEGANWAGLQSSAAWQQLLNTMYGTLGSPTAVAATPTPQIGTTAGGPGPMVRGPRFAHGGEVPSVKTPVASHLPYKPPKADYALPKLPHMAGYAVGGAVKYPIHTPEHALASLERANREGSDAEQKTVARQVAAHYPHLGASGAAQATPTATPAPVPPAKPAPYSIRTAPEAMASLEKAEAAGDAHAVEVLRRQIAAHYPTHARDLHWRGITGALKAPTPKNFKAGGPVPGRAAVKGDSYANDTVPAVVSPGELIIDRETLADKGPAGEAARYLADYLKRRNGGR